MNNIKKDLIYKAINGNKASLDTLLKHEYGNIYAMLFYLNKNDNELCDVVQNVLIKIANKISQLKNINSYKSWLNQIVINTYYDYCRKNKKLNQIKLSNDDSVFDSIDNSSNPQEDILKNELDIIVKRSINNLPDHYKVPLTLRELQGMSYSNISGLTKTSLGTVKSRIARARSIIKEEIDKYIKE